MKRILVAGIGNIFMGDDAFGVEVAERLIQQPMPREVRVADFGIRSYDLAYTLMDGWDATILVDIMKRGREPGTLYLIQPDMSAIGTDPDEVVNAHGMDPLTVLRMVRSLGGEPSRLYVIGCEPAMLPDDEGAMRLSPEVDAAIPGAIEMIRSLVGRILNDEDIASPDLEGVHNESKGE
jgi:hydrogenase maturation protease